MSKNIPETVEECMAAMSLEQKEFVARVTIRNLFWDYDTKALNPDKVLDASDVVMDLVECAGTVLSELGVVAPDSTPNGEEEE